MIWNLEQEFVGISNGYMRELRKSTKMKKKSGAYEEKKEKINHDVLASYSNQKDYKV